MTLLFAVFSARAGFAGIGLHPPSDDSTQPQINGAIFAADEIRTVL